MAADTRRVKEAASGAWRGSEGKRKGVRFASGVQVREGGKDNVGREGSSSDSSEKCARFPAVKEQLHSFLPDENINHSQLHKKKQMIKTCLLSTANPIPQFLPSSVFKPNDHAHSARLSANSPDGQNTHGVSKKALRAPATN